MLDNEIPEIDYSISSVSSPSLSKTNSFNLKEAEIDEHNAPAIQVYSTFKNNNNQLLTNKGHLVFNYSESLSDGELEDDQKRVSVCNIFECYGCRREVEIWILICLKGVKGFDEDSVSGDLLGIGMEGIWVYGAIG